MTEGGILGACFLVATDLCDAESEHTNRGWANAVLEKETATVNCFFCFDKNKFIRVRAFSL